MPSWIAKVAVQGFLSVVPGGRYGNRWLQQRRRTTGRDFFDAKLATCRRHLQHLFSTGYPPSAPFEALELGTGRVPLIPLGLALCGARQVTTIDMVSLLQPALTFRAIRYLVDEADRERLQEQLPWVQSERLRALREVCDAFDEGSLGPILSRLGIKTPVGDIRSLERPPRPFDLIVSNNTLEHIAPATLSEIFATFYQLAAPGATMSHFIDLADHYSHYDRRLTPYNFLRYSENSWWLFNNQLQYQNRWRVGDYRAVHAAAGFRILREENDGSAARSLERIRLAPEFRHYPQEDLAVTSSWMVSRRDEARDVRNS